MDAASSSGASTPIGRSPMVVVALAAMAVVLAVAALAVVAAQVEVTDDTVRATRTCGSVFDSVADRSGWEVWWARDLDEPDDAIRAALVRTTTCPDAINARLAIAAVLASVAATSAIVAAVLRRRSRSRHDATAGYGRVARLGRITTAVGAGLTAAGVIGIVLLLADADSTLFLYTDRAVVAVIGLIVLVPAIALIVLGRALVLAGIEFDSARSEQGDA